jgi:hypothetical protein
MVSDLAKAGTDVKKFLRKAAADAPVVVQKIAADEEALAPIIEAFAPQSGVAITLGMTLLDKVAQAVEDAGPAAGASGLSVSLDQAVVNDVKAIIAAAKATFGAAPSIGGTAPAPPVVPAAPLGTFPTVGQPSKK